MKLLPVLAILLLAGCGGGEEPTADAPDTNRIEQLSTPQEEEPDPQATARLEPVMPADIEREGLLGAGCDFRSGAELLLVATGSDAIARFGGELVHLVHSSPMGPTGGFFEDRKLSISVGRTSEAATTRDESTGWPARATVTNRRTRAQAELTGVWTCGA